MRPYPMALRTQALHLVLAGTPKTEVARRLGIGRSTVTRYLHQNQRTGSLAPHPIPGRPPRIGAADAARLQAQIAAAPDATLAEHCAQWEADHGVRVSRSTMARAIARLDWVRVRRP